MSSLELGMIRTNDPSSYIILYKKKFLLERLTIMKCKTTIRSSVYLFVTAVGVLGLGSCVPLAVGAAAGYVAHEEGYRVQSPVTR
jgi:hypothetical protein